MKEKLIIRNFGPIKDVELELGRFNIVIGENATGKSTVAKILAICRYFSYIYELIDSPTPQRDSSFTKGLKSWGLDKFIKNDSYVYYECKDYSVEAKNTFLTESEIIHDQETGEAEEIIISGYFFVTKLIEKSAEFKDLIENLKKLRPSDNTDNSYGYFDSLNWDIPSYFFSSDVAKVMDNPFYIFTERGLQSIFSLGKNSINNLTDSLFNQFASLDQITKRFVTETDIEPLEIIYKNINGKGVFKTNNQDTFMDLETGASGYQSAIPIVLIIKYYIEIRKKRKSFIVEEPELNLFPKTQNKLIQFLADKVINYFNNSILITTHSPYILMSLNNLMFAYKTGQNYSEKVNKIIEKRYWIKPEEVSAYMLLTTGVSESIIDGEGLIRTEKIDSVSGILNKEFNEIFDLELSTK